MDFRHQLLELIEHARQLISDIKPSAWAESKRVMSSEISPFPGPFRYDRSPYVREIVDCLAPDHPADTIAIMKGAQIGLSAGLIENGLGYIISENPGPTVFYSGHAELSDAQMVLRIDQMIESCGLRHLIRPNVVKKKNQRTGDTISLKEFPGGFLMAGTANNHKLLRQNTFRFGFFDDFEAVRGASKESGSTEKMIEQRFAAFGDKSKKFYISTPELEENSNIEAVYEKGDKRKFHLPCPCCGVFISLEWETFVAGSEGTKKAGITWQVDENGKLVDDSVGYVCQECGEFFNESHKGWMLSQGEWRPTAEPSRKGYYSYHISSLYAPPGMYNWTHYVRQYLEAENATTKKQALLQAFYNLVLGKTYTPSAEEPKANDLQNNNIRKYEIGTVPEKLSMADGNGRILLLTCGCDMNGTEDDARLDYEIVAWAESGASYSIRHGSIGTFIPKEKTLKNKIDRRRWTYRTNSSYSVWPELTKILQATYQTDTGRAMRILQSGIDCGHYSNYAYNYIDQFNSKFRVGLKGTEESKLMKYGIDVAAFRPAKERSLLYLVEVNALKDDLAEMMRLKWLETHQPPGFMNFPTPSDGLYLYQNFFAHYESEHKIQELKDGISVGFRWVKKKSNVQNHMWDCRVYNIVLRDIFVHNIFNAYKTLKVRNPQWADYVALLKSENKKK